MLNKQDIINILNIKQYPKSEYWIITGAGLVLHGVKSETRDIDIGCTALLADLLINNGAKWQALEDGRRKIIVGSNIDLVENSFADFTDEVVEINGLSVASLKCIRNIKIELNRQKDLDDIILIDKFINSRTQ